MKYTILASFLVISNTLCQQEEDNASEEVQPLIEQVREQMRMKKLPITFKVRDRVAAVSIFKSAFNKAAGSIIYGATFGVKDTHLVRLPLDISDFSKKNELLWSVTIGDDYPDNPLYAAALTNPMSEKLCFIVAPWLINATAELPENSDVLDEDSAYEAVVGELSFEDDEVKKNKVFIINSPMEIAEFAKKGDLLWSVGIDATDIGIIVAYVNPVDGKVKIMLSSSLIEQNSPE